MCITYKYNNLIPVVSLYNHKMQPSRNQCTCFHSALKRAEWRNLVHEGQAKMEREILMCTRVEMWIVQVIEYKMYVVLFIIILQNVPS